MIAKENGKADILKWLKRKISWQKVGDLDLTDLKIRLPLYYEPVKQQDGSKKMQVVAWCPYAKIVMEDIILSKDTIHSIELVEGAKPVRDMPWAKDGLTWKVNVYDIDLTLSNDLVVEPTRMPATLRIVASASCTDIFSYMGIKTDFPIADGPIASRFE